LGHLLQIATKIVELCNTAADDVIKGSWRMGLFDKINDDWTNRVTGFIQGKGDDFLYDTFKSKQDIEKYMQQNRLWHNSGNLNPSNERIVNNIWDYSQTRTALVEEKRRRAQEAAVEAETAKQKAKRSAQKTAASSKEGRRGTILTSSQGVQESSVDPMGRKSLLGE
jgi:hypothetical protein